MASQITNLINQATNFLKEQAKKHPAGYKLAYDHLASYQENYHKGPLLPTSPINLIQEIDKILINSQKWQVMGHQIATPFGIPAGPLLNGKKFIIGQKKPGYLDFLGQAVYVRKTVRSKFWEVHPTPNVAFLEDNSPIKPTEILSTRQATLQQPNTTNISITNSFGVPSEDPIQDTEFPNWQQDVIYTRQKLAQKAPSAYLIVSVQGSQTPQRSLAEDYAYTAYKALEAYQDQPAHIEMNFSCPNTKKGDKGGVIYCDPQESALQITKKVREKVGSQTKLVAKIGYYQDDQTLKNFLKYVGPHLDGISSINTISLQVNDLQGQSILPGRKTSGICGYSIFDLSFQQAQKLADYRQKFKLDHLSLNLGGGVMTTSDYQKYLEIAQPTGGYVFAATGLWVDPYLGLKIKISQLQELL